MDRPSTSPRNALAVLASSTASQLAKNSEIVAVTRVQMPNRLLPFLSLLMIPPWSAGLLVVRLLSSPACRTVPRS